MAFVLGVTAIKVGLLSAGGAAAVYAGFSQEFRDYIMFVLESPKRYIYRSENAKSEVEEARRKVNINFNYAFMGHFKAGKSTLINSLRGMYYDEDHPNNEPLSDHEGEGPLSDHDELVEANKRLDDRIAQKRRKHNPKNPAMTGRFHIHNFQYYEFPDDDYHVRFYDVPGSGDSTIEEYFKEFGLIAFDCLIILVQQTPCREEIELAKYALSKNLPICFVRSKCDSDLLEPLAHKFPNPKRFAKEIEKLNQSHANQKMNEFKCMFEPILQEHNLLEARDKVPYFCISSSILRRKFQQEQKELMRQNFIEGHFEEMDDEDDEGDYNFKFEEDAFLKHITKVTEEFRRDEI